MSARICSISLISMVLGGCLTAANAEAESQEILPEFLTSGHMNLLLRNFYFHRDFRHGGFNSAGRNAFKAPADRNGYSDEWVQTAILNYESGFTPGLIGIGVDGFVAGGVKLNSGGGRTGTLLLPIDSEGRSEDNYSKGGVVGKLKVSNTVAKYGPQFPNVPVFSVSTIRALPASATGLTVKSDEFKDLSLDYGRFTSASAMNSSNQDEELTTDYSTAIHGRSVEYVGATYKLKGTDNIRAYASTFKDVWHQYYLGSNLSWALSPQDTLTLQLNAYRNKGYGAELGGPIDTSAWSAMAGYQHNAHTFSIGYQKVLGDEPLDWIGFGSIGGNVSLTNGIQYATFLEAHERSWQLRYDLNMAAYGIPGLTFMARYVRGDGMDNSGSDNRFYTARHVYDPEKDNKHWERNLEAKYVVQSGKAKDLSFRLRQASHRGTTGNRFVDMDEVRLIIDYPISFF